MIARNQVVSARSVSAFHENVVAAIGGKGLRKNNLDNLTALRKERVVPLRMESSWLEIQLVHF
jgi:hypothetical protein